MLVMRLETAAAKLDRKVVASLPSNWDAEKADLRELLTEAARRIKQLEASFVRQPPIMIDSHETKTLTLYALGEGNIAVLRKL